MLADCRTPAPKGLSVSSSMQETPSRSVHDDEYDEEHEEDEMRLEQEEPAPRSRRQSSGSKASSKAGGSEVSKPNRRLPKRSPPNRSPSKDNSVFDRLMTAGNATRAKLEQKRHDAKGANDRESGD